MAILKSIQSYNFKQMSHIRFISETCKASNTIEQNNKPKSSYLKSWREIPGPPSWPVIGSMLEFWPGRGSLSGKIGYDLFDYLYKSYGPISKMKIFLNKPMVYLFDPEAIAQVFHGENLNPVRPSLQSIEHYRKVYAKKHSKHQTIYNGTTGLLTEHGSKWKEFRSIVNPILLKPENILPYNEPMDEVACDMVKRIKHIRNKNNKVPEDFGFEINKWSLESISVVALGTRLGCLKRDFQAESTAGRLIKVICEVNKTSIELDFSPSLWRIYPTAAYKRAMTFFDEQVSLTRHFIKKAMLVKQSNTSIRSNNNILQNLSDIDENVAIIMTNDMMLGGVDTTSNAMLPTLYLLAKNPKKQEILRQEILSKNTNKPYMRAVIKESFRVMPAVSGNLRCTTKEYNLCGYKIPKNTYVFFCHHHLSLMENQYPKPREFIPERWIVNKDDPLYHGNAQAFAYLPFGFGTRQCIGKKLLELQFETLLTRLVENFQIGWEGPEPVISASAMNYFVGPYNFIFEDIK